MSKIRYLEDVIEEGQIRVVEILNNNKDKDTNEEQAVSKY